MISSLSTTTILAIIDLLVKTSLLISLAMLASWRLRTKSPTWGHFALTLGFIAALLVPILTRCLPALKVIPFDAWWIRPNVSVVSNTPANSMTSQSVIAANTTVNNIGSSQTNTVGSSLGHLPSWLWQILAIWVIGTLFVLARYVIGLLALKWIEHKHTSNLCRGDLLSAKDQISKRTGIQRDWKLYFSSSSKVTVPMTWGTWRPTVILPSDAQSWSTNQFEAVLLHELAHVRRFDFLTQMVAEVTCAAYWFNPIVWLGARALRSDAELAADEAVLQTGLKPSEYATELMSLAASIGTRKQPFAYVGTLAMKNSKIENRLHSILQERNNRRGMTTTQILAASLAAILVVPALAVTQLTLKQADTGSPSPDHSESMSRLKNAALATIMYAADSDDYLPYTQSTHSTANVLMPYAKNKKIFQSPLKTGNFEYNLNVAGVLMTDIASPAETPLWVETIKGSNDPSYIAFVDGHVAKKTQAELKKGMALKFKRKPNSKPLPAGYMANPVIDPR